MKGIKMVKEIKMPIYYIIEETGEKYYDFEAMANSLENTIYLLLNRRQKSRQKK